MASLPGQVVVDEGLEEMWIESSESIATIDPGECVYVCERESVCVTLMIPLHLLPSSDDHKMCFG